MHFMFISSAESQTFHRARETPEEASTENVPLPSRREDIYCRFVERARQQPREEHWNSTACIPGCHSDHGHKQIDHARRKEEYPREK